MNIPLNVLIEACHCLELAREAEAHSERLKTDQYVRCLKASIDFKWYVEQITSNQKVEVAA